VSRRRKYRRTVPHLPSFNTTLLNIPSLSPQAEDDSTRKPPRDRLLRPINSLAQGPLPASLPQYGHGELMEGHVNSSSTLSVSSTPPIHPAQYLGDYVQTRRASAKGVHQQCRDSLRLPARLRNTLQARRAGEQIDFRTDPRSGATAERDVTGGKGLCRLTL
jgi:hypothetical protein